MSNFKGILGETVINIATWFKLDKAVYHRLNNITLPLSNSGSTQIDHIIVSIYGIFVIETKNYKGWIYGSEKQKQWTQVFPNGQKYKFQNPLRQNYLHIKTLADLLGLEINAFHSMIAFIGECELKTHDELPEHVLKGGVISYIKKKQDKILTEAEVQSIVERIETKRFAKSWRSNREHKAYIRDKHANAGNEINTSQKYEINSSPNPKLEVQSNAKTSEVPRWSGQVEQADSSILEFNSKNDVFMTPFDITKFDPEISEPEVSNSQINEVLITEKINKPVIVDTIPACPKCNSEMIERIAKKGAHQGQPFFGCSKFPKCWGTVSIS